MAGGPFPWVQETLGQQNEGTWLAALQGGGLVALGWGCWGTHSEAVLAGKFWEHLNPLIPLIVSCLLKCGSNR